MDQLFSDENDVVIVKSRQTLQKYDFYSYIKNNRDCFSIIKTYILRKMEKF